MVKKCHQVTSDNNNIAEQGSPAVFHIENEIIDSSLIPNQVYLR